MILTAVASGTADVAAVAAADGRRLFGFSCRESDGTPAAAEFIIRHGVADTAPAVIFVNLAANGSQTEWFGFDGLPFQNGIFVDRISGTTEISLWHNGAAK